MTKRTHFIRFAVLGLALALPLHAHAQTMSYGGNGVSADSDDGDEDDTSSRSRSGRSGKRLSITPYIEAQQVATAQLTPGNDVVTYTSVAAGIDAALQGRNTKGAVSLRYERRFGYGQLADSDVISGVARLGTTLIPNALNVEAGALATRTSVSNNGAVVLGTPVSGNSSAQLYSVYGGPTIKAHMGDVSVDGGYRIGYTKVGTDSNIAGAVGGPALDVFDESIAHNAEIRFGTKPGDMLPVGLGVGGGYYQEDISNLDQRVRNMHARADAVLPVGGGLSLVGGVGYEDVEVSSRDAVRDVNGVPVIGSNGRYVTDKTVARTLSYDTSGLIWDAGVMWRPSKRTALEAHVGRRYGSTSYYGSFAYAPNRRTSLNVSVYDSISGLGGQVNSALAGLPTDFSAARNPFNGDLGGCVVSVQGGNCLTGALGSVRSATFRARGVSASLGYKTGSIQAGVGLGYDRRKFLAAPGTVLASANGVIDQNYWMSGYINGRIDRNSSFGTTVYANWYQSGFAGTEDAKVVGATASYYRNLGDHLTATAALGIDGINRESQPDLWNASALVGVRYSF